MAYKVISADGHVESHPEHWHPWIAAKYREQAPTIGPDKNGKETWVMGDFTAPLNMNLSGGLPYDQMVEKNMVYRDPDGSFRPGAGDGLQRVRLMAQDGIDAEVLFPPVAVPDLIAKLLESGEKDAYLAILQGYNSWLAQEFCAVAPDRMIGVPIVPVSGVDDAIAEMERCAGMGLRGVCLSTFPNGGGDPDPDDDRFWAASLEMNMKLAPHSTFGHRPTAPQPGNSDMGSRSRISPRPTRTIGQLISKGVLDRYPELKFYFGEADVGWIPYHVESSDDWFLRKYHDRGLRLRKLPSQYWRDHMRFSFLSDPAAIEMRYLIGLDLIMWGSDLPHVTGSFPNSREVLDAFFRDVPDDERDQILVGNVCDFFGLDPDAELTPVP